jgi:hypothetical protein
MRYAGGDTMDESEKSQLEVIQSELTETRDKVIEIGHSLKRIEKNVSYHQIGNIGFGGMCAGMALVAGSRFVSEGVAIFLLGVMMYIVSLLRPRGK